MPGSLVTDYGAAVQPLVGAQTAGSAPTGAAITATGNGSSRQFIGHLGVEHRIKLVVGTVSGTSPTLDISVEGSDDSAHASGVVEYGRFGQLTSADNAGGNRWLTIVPQHAYLRFRYVAGGTSPSFTLTGTVEEAKHLRSKADAST